MATGLSAGAREIVEFAISSKVIEKTSKSGSYRMRRGVADIYHTMGYYALEPRSTTPKQRLASINEALLHIAANLVT